MKSTEMKNGETHIEGEMTDCLVPGVKAKMVAVIGKDLKATWFVYAFEHGSLRSDSMYSQHWRAKRDFDHIVSSENSSMGLAMDGRSQN